MRSIASNCIAASVRTTGSTSFSGRGALDASKTNEKLFVSVDSRRPGFQTAAVTSTQTRPRSQTWTTCDLSARRAPTSTGRTKSTCTMDRVVGAHLRETPSTRRRTVSGRMRRVECAREGRRSGTPKMHMPWRTPVLVRIASARLQTLARRCSALAAGWLWRSSSSFRA